MRLFALVGGLMIVVILMSEARKPERWHWLTLFGQNGNKQPLVAEPWTVQDSDGKNGSPAQQEPVTPEPVAGQDTSTEQDPTASGVQASPGRSLRSEQDFWRDVFLELPREDQKAFFGLLRDQDSGAIYTPADKEKLLDLLDRVDQNVQSHLLQVIQTATQSNGTESGVPVTQPLLDITKPWTDKTLPYLRSTVRKDLEMLDFDRAQLALLRSYFENAMLSLIEDHGQLLSPIEGPGWLVVWDRVLKDKAGKYRTVTHFDLSSQPETYRGEPVEIDGMALLIERVTMAKNILGVEEYYVIWVRSDEIGKTPFCVYTLELPPGTESFAARRVSVKWKVKIDGYFFKIRTYVDQQSKVGECPMILARSCISLPVPVTASNDEFQWKVPWWFIAAMLSLLAALAIGIAKAVYDSSKARRYKPSPEFEMQLKSGLKKLASDPDIQSDRERVANLE